MYVVAKTEKPGKSSRTREVCESFHALQKVNRFENSGAQREKGKKRGVGGGPSSRVKRSVRRETLEK